MINKPEDSEQRLNDTSSESCGVLFIATGEMFVDASIRCARSILKHCPGLKIHIFCDKEQYHRLNLLRDNPFSSSEEIENPHVRSKVDYLPLSPFQRTLYLDADTMVLDDIREVFQLFDRFDIALAHAHIRNANKSFQKWNIQLPISFPQFNGGVICFRKSGEVLEFLDKWKNAYHTANFKKDQVTLRELLWNSDLRIVTLPPEYNIRFSKYLWVWKKIRGKT